MRLALIGGTRGWHAEDLRRAAKTLDIEIECVDFRDLRSRVDHRIENGIEIHSGSSGFDLGRAHCALVRSMPAGSLEQIVYRMDVLHALEASGVSVVNRPRALECAIDKFLSLCRLSAAGIRVPETTVDENVEAALDSYEKLGGDVVSKPLFGSEGRGLRRLRSKRDAEACFLEICAAGGVIYQQRFVRHPGYDIRVLVFRGEVLGAMRRRVTHPGWITNVAQGGLAEPIELTDEDRELAIRAAEATDAELAGVDLLPDFDESRLVLEVNAVPGWRALSSVIERDLSTDILSRLRRGLNDASS